MTFRVAYWPFPVQVMLLYAIWHFISAYLHLIPTTLIHHQWMEVYYFGWLFTLRKKLVDLVGLLVGYGWGGSHALCSWGLAVSLQACFAVWFEVCRHASKYLQQYIYIYKYIYIYIQIYIYCSFNRKIPSFQHLSCCKSETHSSLPTQSLRDTAGNVACSSLQALCFTWSLNKTLWDPHICSCRSKLTWKRHVSSSFSASKK